MGKTIIKTDLIDDNNSFMGTVKSAVKSFGLPRLIISLFLLLMFILAPFVGANLGYGFGVSRNTVGGLFTSAEIGYRYLANSRISLYVSVRAQFQQATITAKTVIDGTTFNNQAGRNFVTLGAHFGFSF